MSVPPDPDPPVGDPRYPTEPVAAHRPVVHEREIVADHETVDSAWLARLDDRVSSLRAWMALVAIIALAGLGLSIYNLIENSGDRRAASQGRVAALSDRISRLEGKSSTSADTNTTTSLSARLGQKASKQDLQKLSDELTQLKADVSNSSTGSGSASTALTQLNTRVDRLTQQVADLQSSSGTSTAP
jgi:hypothetical protein